MSISQEYISIAANRSSSCCATSNLDPGFVAFGAGKVVALWNSSDETGKGVYQTLPGHGGVVTKVIIMEGKAGDAIISGDDKGEVRVWSQDANGTFISASKLQAHSASISSLGALDDSVPNACLLFFSGGSDASVKVWRLTHSSSTSVELVQIIDLSGKLPLDLAIASTTSSDGGSIIKAGTAVALILAIATTTKHLQIHTSPFPSPSLPKPQFTLATTLEGHEDWIRSLSFSPYGAQDLMLASGSQDGYIRLWRVTKAEAVGERAAEMDASKVGGGLDDEMLDEFERRMGEGATGGGGRQLSTKSHLLSVDGSSTKYNIALETLLIGHEGWVTNLSWSPISLLPTLPECLPVLLSTAADNSMIIWAPDSYGSSLEHRESIWLAKQRFGEMGGKGLGLFGALWVVGRVGKGVDVVANGWNGGFQRWGLAVENGNEGRLDILDGEWEPRIAPTGHALGVKCIDWDPKSEYLISCSTDQTTRIHALWTRPSATNPSKPSQTWAEISRPQIHGYDLTCVSFIDRFRFVSGADEKIVRVFDATRGFVRSLEGLGVSRVEVEEASRSVGASVPPLGLSNRALSKPVDESHVTESQGYNTEHISISDELHDLPTEAVLAASTLWPEIEKLYGHGYELMACATSPSGRLIATSCKATTAEHAVIRLYSTSSWKQIGQPLEGHNLTITKIAFSHDERFILSCSRDRTWRLFSAVDGGEGYEAIAAEKPHARIIWDCVWAPDDSYFATVSRDKQLKLWSRTQPGSESKWSMSAVSKLPEAVTAVDIIGGPDDQDIIAAGLEDGSIHIFAYDGQSLKPLLQVGQGLAHVDHIYRLAWRKNGENLQLASCSEDRSVRILNVNL